jgi:hypothetical protein
MEYDWNARFFEQISRRKDLAILQTHVEHSAGRQLRSDRRDSILNRDVGAVDRKALSFNDVLYIEGNQELVFNQHDRLRHRPEPCPAG